ncbi:MAG: hypothetical protein GY832_41245, partial [Chloroflexi bacterium]|nr:hypothetical protein [Chloroflexota bacterium]
CLNVSSPVVSVEGVTYPPAKCPHIKPHLAPHGKVINIRERFKDESIRLVRDIPVGTPAWKRLYHRARNAVEGPLSCPAKDRAETPTLSVGISNACLSMALHGARLLSSLLTSGSTYQPLPV